MVPAPVHALPGSTDALHHPRPTLHPAWGCGGAQLVRRPHSPHGEGYTRAATPGTRSTFPLPRAVPDRQGRQKRNMACGKFGSAQTLLRLQLLQNLMNAPGDMSCTSSQPQCLH